MVLSLLGCLLRTSKDKNKILIKWSSVQRIRNEGAHNNFSSLQCCILSFLKEKFDSNSAFSNVAYTDACLCCSENQPKRNCK